MSTLVKIVHTNGSEAIQVKTYQDNSFRIRGVIQPGGEMDLVLVKGNAIQLEETPASEDTALAEPESIPTSDPIKWDDGKKPEDPDADVTDAGFDPFPGLPDPANAAADD